MLLPPVEGKAKAKEGGDLGPGGTMDFYFWPWSDCI